MTRNGITRRDLLGRTVAIAAGASASSLFLARVTEALSNLPATDAGGRVLVLIQLAGGNDGLNTVVPAADPLYRTLRPSVALGEPEILAFSDRLAVHSALAPLKGRFEKGQLAVVQGVGLPKPDRSHFVSTAVWQAGRTDARDASGWLGRALDLFPPAPAAALSSPLPAIGIGGGGLSPALVSARTPVPSLLSLDAFAVMPDRRYPGDALALRRGLDALYASGSAPQTGGFVSSVGRVALQSSDGLKAAVSTYSSTVSYPRGAFGDQLKLVSQILGAGLPPRLFHVTLGGFDTHANQKPQQRNLLGQLAEGITAFLDDAAAHSFSDRVAVMTYSEFGRRAAENASAGTDHGAGSVLFLAGDGVAGGLHGTAPDLGKLVDGDVPVSTDFRSVYASVLESWLSLSPESVLGSKVAPLPLFRAGPSPASSRR